MTSETTSPSAMRASGRARRLNQRRNARNTIGEVRIAGSRPSRNTDCMNARGSSAGISSFIARAWLIAIILFVVAARFDRTAGLTAAGVFLAAFTFDLMGRTLLFTVNERARKQDLPE